MAGRLQDVILRGTAALKPLATTVAPGTLYFSTDTNVTERCADDGLTWQSYSGTGSVFSETTAPTPPIANQANVWLQDNGAGKSQLMIQFATGAPIVIATQL